MAFVLPTMYSAPRSWGPPDEEGECNGLPMELYNKADKIMLVSDFLDEKDEKVTVDEEGFRIEVSAQLSALDRKKKQKELPGLPTRGRGRGGYYDRGAQRGGRGGRGGARGGRGGRGWVRREILYRTPTRELSDDYLILDRFNLPDFLKMTHSPVPAAQDLRIFGRPRMFNTALDAASSKKPLPLPDHSDADFSRCATIIDPIVREIAGKAEGDMPIIFTTDVVLATLMNAPRSVASWDVEIRQFQRFTFINARNESACDTFWVDENMQDGAPNDAQDKENESIDHHTPLGRESTKVSRFFAETSRLKTMYQGLGAEKNPFEAKDGSKPTSNLYRYRSWTIDAGKPTAYQVVVRCEIDSIYQEKKDGPIQYVRSFGLLERPGSNWRDRLVKERGALFATEIKKNTNKFAKWTAIALLSGADVMKIGYVARVKPTENDKHHILACETFQPADFAVKIGMRPDNVWGVFNHLSVLIRRAATKYQQQLGLLKDPHNPILTMFVVPPEEVARAGSEDESPSESDSDSSSDESSSSNDDSSSDSSDEE